MKINKSTTNYYTYINKNTENNTILGVPEGQSFGSMLYVSLYIVSPSITLIHSSTSLSTIPFLHMQFL